MITRQEISQFFIIILFQNILFSQHDLIPIPETLDPDQSYFSILISPDQSYIGLTNSNYTTLEIINQKTSKNTKVSVPFINTFQAKWSPHSDKLLLLRSRYDNKRRANSLIVINHVGDFVETIVDFTNQNLYPLGWTGNNTLHYLSGEKLITYSLEGSDNEWDYPLVYAIKNKLFRKINDRDHEILYTAENRILNVSSSRDGSLVAFEEYGSHVIIIDNLKTVTTDLGIGNGPKVSPNGKMVTFMVLEDNGYQITSGDVYIWDSVSKEIKAVAHDPEFIEMNPVWSSDDLVSYIIYPEGLVKTVSIK